MRSLLLSLVVISAVSAVAETPVRRTADARTTDVPLAFTSTQFDFGKVVSGNKVSHDFEYVNRGAETVRIAGVEFGCDCSVAAKWEKGIAAGEKGRLSVTMSTDALRGRVAKTVTISYAKPAGSKTVLRMQGDVWPALEITPRFATLGAVKKAAEAASTKIRIRSNLDRPLAFNSTSCNNAAFVAALKETRAGREFELTVKSKGPLVPGLNEGLVILNTSSAERPRITVPVTLYLLSKLEVVPRTVLLPPGPLAKPFERRIYITRNGTKPLKVTEASSNVDGVTVGIEELQPGAKFRLRARFPKGFMAPEGKAAQVSFKTDDPTAPLVAIPVTQARAAKAETQ